MIGGLAVLACHIACAQQGAGTDGQWRFYSGDQGSTKYSPLDQINASNVGNLKVAWQRPLIDPDFLEQHPKLRYSNNFRSTPIYVDGVLYLSNGIGLVEAVDPATGKTLWLQKPFESGSAGLRGWAARGVAYWSDRAQKQADLAGDVGGKARNRIFSVRGEHLIALDAQTGDFIEDFGDEGRVNLTVGLGPLMKQYQWTSVPVVIRDVVIVGSAMVFMDSAVTKEGPPGDVRAYDARTGELKWTFNVIPRAGDAATATWDDDSWQYTGAGNVWSLMSADEELGYVYLPTSSATNDMYGGHRLGDNLYTDSIVCVDATTGKRVWHFQTVHHDLWDYDNPAAPVLGDVTVDGKRTRIVAQITKQSFAYVLDRVTGKPLWPIVERPVPRSTVPGEVASATQPFPTRPPPFDRQGISLDDLIDFTPQLRAEAEQIAGQYVLGPMFTPPSVYSDDPAQKKGTLQLPGSVGGADWTGAAFDPDTGILYVPSMTSPFVADLQPGDPKITNLRYQARSRELIHGPRGLPLLKPPYGRITAIDLNRGEQVWMVPNGDGPRNHPAIRHLNLPPLGHAVRASPLVTKTLLFVSEGDQINVRTPPDGGGNKLRAFDKATGEILWTHRLSAGSTGAMMSYRHQGKQYLIVPIGGREHRAEFIAFSLP